MSRKLYVANLSHVVEKTELQRLFAAHGTVRGVHVVRRAGRGGETATAFIEMDSQQDGRTAIAALNGMPHRGRALLVSWATPGQSQGIDGARMFEPMNMADTPQVSRRPGRVTLVAPRGRN